MIQLSMVEAAGPHFAAEIRIGIVSVLERFQAFPTLQNLTRDTSCTSPGIAKDRKLISIFIFVNQAPISIDVTNVKTSSTGTMSIQMKIPKKQRIWSKYWCGSKIISSGSLKLSVCEVVVLMCTSNPQSISSKLHLEVGEPKTMFYFSRTQSESNVISLYLTCESATNSSQKLNGNRRLVHEDENRY